jgi:hypothetical protein
MGYALSKREFGVEVAHPNTVAILLSPLLSFLVRLYMFFFLLSHGQAALIALRSGELPSHGSCSTASF